MAFELDKEQPTGVLANYHRIERAEINYSSKQAFIYVGSYLNRAARQTGKAFIVENQFDISDAPELFASPENPHDKEVTRKNVYDILREKEFFDGATEV